MQGMVKHSKRATKCKRCGLAVRWYHDTGRTGRNECAEHGLSSWVMVPADVDVEAGEQPQQHVPTRDGEGCRTRDYVPQGKGKGDQGKGDSREAGKGETVTTKTEQGSKGKGGEDATVEDLKRVLGSLVEAPQVDEFTVATMVESTVKDREQALLEQVEGRLDSLRVPTRVTVNDATTGETHEVEGVTHEVLPKVLRVMDAGVAAWLVGPAGTGKSTIASQAADALGLGFGAISLSPNTSLAEIVGYRDANGAYQSTEFRKAYEHGGVFLFDEVDNGHPSTLAKLNMALSNGSMAFPDGMVERHADFRAVAAANTYGTGADRTYVGRLHIDGATLDRFATIYVGVDEALETLVAEAQGAPAKDVERLLDLVRKCRSKADEQRLPLVFSPRASIDGARLLAAGLTFDEVVDMRVRKGISEQDWNKVAA